MKKEWEVLQEFAYILSVGRLFRYRSNTHVILVPPHRPTSIVRRPNTPARWGHPRLRNIYQRLGKTEEQTRSSCTIYSARLGLGQRLLFEDGPFESVHNCYVYVLLFSSLLRTDNISVINPSIRMTWIMNNWEKKWVDNSVNIIKELVSIESTSDSKFEIVY